MRKKEYIRVEPYEPTLSRESKKMTQQQKEARIHALAKKLKVKIGGKE